MATTDEEIVGVGAIKQAWPRYSSGTARKSGFPFDRNMLELGHVARDPSHRSHDIPPKIVWTSGCSPLCSLCDYLTRENERDSERAGFVQEENDWPEKDENTLSLWLKPTQAK